MSADLISADFKSKTWVSDRQRQEADKQALEVMTAALMGEPGMCGMEPVVYLEMMDTACVKVTRAHARQLMITAVKALKDARK